MSSLTEWFKGDRKDPLTDAQLQEFQSLLYSSDHADSFLDYEEKSVPFVLALADAHGDLAQNLLITVLKMKHVFFDVCEKGHAKWLTEIMDKLPDHDVTKILKRSGYENLAASTESEWLVKKMDSLSSDDLTDTLTKRYVASLLVCNGHADWLIAKMDAMTPDQVAEIFVVDGVMGALKTCDKEDWIEEKLDLLPYNGMWRLLQSEEDCNSSIARRRAELSGPTP